VRDVTICIALSGGVAGATTLAGCVVDLVALQGGSASEGDDGASNIDASGVGGSPDARGGSDGRAGAADGSVGGAAGAGGHAGEDDADAGAGVEARPDGSELDGADPDVGEVCSHDPDDVLCTRMQRNCGAFTAVDNCGTARVFACGACAAPSFCGGSGTLNVCSGGEPVNRAQGGTVTASEAADPKPSEDRTMPFDNNVNTKWFVHSIAPWIAYRFSGGATYAIDAYAITSANDTPNRDPRSWQLQGSNDGVNWTTLDTQVNQTFVLRFQTNSYAFSNTTAYSAYRFFVTANAGNPTQFQVAEIQLFGNPGSTLDAGVVDASVDASNDASNDAASD
jgi:hypothetical protein